MIKLFERKVRDHNESQHAWAIRQENSISLEWAEFDYRVLIWA